jgi:hypothetical protein
VSCPHDTDGDGDCPRCAGGAWGGCPHGREARYPNPVRSAKRAAIYLGIWAVGILVYQVISAIF